MKLQTLRSEMLTVQVSEHGAELQSIQTANGLELLWQGDPTIWARRAPNLFPIVGRLKNDQLHYQGKTYHLPQHGFARDLPFQLESASEHSCTFLLKDSPQTFQSFPFHFELRLTHKIRGSEIEILYSVTNPDSKVLFCSVGAHAGFAWPLVPGTRKNDHKIIFEKFEPAPIRRLKGGLILPETFPTPVQGTELSLSDDLFHQEAIFFDQLQSRSLCFQGPSDVSLQIDFPDFPHLGVWSKIGSPFLCIEPWEGHHSPEGFDGEFSEKPGVVRVRPHTSREWRYTIQVKFQ